MKQIYEDFAIIYDDVMADLFANIWLKAFSRLKKKHHINYQSMVDLGCGSGSIARNLAGADQSLYLVDQSRSMLNQAKQRCPNATIITSDMRRFQLPEPVDLAVSVYGTIHYLTAPKALLKFFNQVKKYLKPNGFFCFDYFTKNHIKTYYGGGIDVFEGDDYLSIWRHRWNDKKQSSDIIIEGFHKQGQLWKRHQPERHDQQVFTWNQIKTQLKEAGFKTIKHYALPKLTAASPADKKRIVLATI